MRDTQWLSIGKYNSVETRIWTVGACSGEADRSIEVCENLKSGPLVREAVDSVDIVRHEGLSDDESLEISDSKEILKLKTIVEKFESPLASSSGEGSLRLFQ